MLDVICFREPGAEQKFKEISNAYEVIPLLMDKFVQTSRFSSYLNILFYDILVTWLQVLSDDEKRSLYDKYGEAGLKGAGMGMGVSISRMQVLFFCER